MAGTLGRSLSTASVSSVPLTAWSSSSPHCHSNLYSRAAAKPWYICAPQSSQLEAVQVEAVEEQTVRNRLEQLIQAQTVGLRSWGALRSPTCDEAEAHEPLERSEPAEVLSLAVQTGVPPRPASCSGNSKGSGGNNRRHPDFYANVGTAIRTLREEIPLLFQRDLTCKYTSAYTRLNGAVLACCQLLLLFQMEKGVGGGLKRIYSSAEKPLLYCCRYHIQGGYCV